MMTLKSDARVHGIRPEIVLAAMVVHAIYQANGLDVVITSGIEGKHSFGSFHYAGAAMDFRTNHVPAEKLPGLVQKITAALGPDFDVLREVDHLHVEFQPKAPYL
jgi:hypothetical protein